MTQSFSCMKDGMLRTLMINALSGDVTEDVTRLSLIRMIGSSSKSELRTRIIDLEVKRPNIFGSQTSGILKILNIREKDLREARSDQENWRELGHFEQKRKAARGV